MGFKKLPKVQKIAKSGHTAPGVTFYDLQFLIKKSEYHKICVLT